MKTMLVIAAVGLTFTIGLTAADAASASSIVFAKGGDVWRSAPDGSHQKRLTRDGGYSTPSQDDRGRVYAVRAGRFVRRHRSRPTASGSPTGAESSRPARR
jgi:hypothetical protein